MSVEIEEFTPDLHPLMAKASLGLRVLTPDVFRCRSTTASALAVAAYNLTRAQESALAIANVAYVGRAAASMVPL
jgi:hypothetical protein